MLLNIGAGPSENSGRFTFFLHEPHNALDFLCLFRDHRIGDRAVALFHLVEAAVLVVDFGHLMVNLRPVRVKHGAVKRLEQLPPGQEISRRIGVLLQMLIDFSLYRQLAVEICLPFLLHLGLRFLELFGKFHDVESVPDGCHLRLELVNVLVDFPDLDLHELGEPVLQ